MRFLLDQKKAGRTVENIAIVNENTDYGTSVGDAIAAEAKCPSANILSRWNQL
jgi:branched-chain amino acid transport system substrate-binding protein